MEQELEALRKENEQLKKKLEAIHPTDVRPKGNTLPALKEEDKQKALSIIVVGATGDLARKKTYPALYKLYITGLLPENTTIAGFARTQLSQEEFIAKITKDSIKGGEPDQRARFLEKLTYRSGQYHEPAHFKALADELESKWEKQKGGASNRIFYMAVPPTIFLPVAKAIRAAAFTQTGWNRVVVEKPFGRDLDSARQLEKDLGSLFDEEQIFRIDHYLGKEMVQNMMTLRFANNVFEPIWNHKYISSVQITFKEDFGTEGRGGYFDEFGIIRDVIQNHLVQMLALVAMEPPVTLFAEDVRDEKTKLLRAIPPIVREDVVVGQYVADKEGKHPGYKDDKTVPPDSSQSTFACCVVHINNSRWCGVPFILKAGKALSERKSEIRIQFKSVGTCLFPDLRPNELVLRVQPGEAVYLKMTTKKPGLTEDTVYAEMDLSYASRFNVSSLPDAYERLILDVIRGDRNLFVRSDELLEAWRVFTPILQQLEKEKPILYEYGTRGPKEADDLIAKAGYIRPAGYEWTPVLVKDKKT